MRYVFALVLLLPVVGVGQEGEKPIIEASARLWNAYHDNELAADAKYTGKTIKVGGSLRQLRKAEGGKYVLHFAYGDSQGATVVCLISPEDAKGFADAKGFDEVWVSGKCLGAKQDAMAYKGIIVVIDGAKRIGKQKLD